MLARQSSELMARPEETAETAVWLCSDAASFATRVAMRVDGGVLAQQPGPRPAHRPGVTTDSGGRTPRRGPVSTPGIRIGSFEAALKEYLEA